MIDLNKYAKKYVVKVCPCDGEHFGDRGKWLEIHGKRGYIRLWGESELEVYVSNTRIAARIERNFKQFKPKNHYDDATAFVIKEESLPLAVKLIKGRNKRQMSQAALERLATARSLSPIGSRKGGLGT